MITAGQIESARAALLQMIRGRQLEFPIQVPIVPVPIVRKGKRLKNRTKYAQLSLFGELPSND